MTVAPAAAQVASRTSDGMAHVASLSHGNGPSPNGGQGSVTGDGTVDVGLTPAEQATQMAVWSMLSAPLLAGTDLSRAAPAALALLGNRDLIAIDQDPEARPPAVDLDEGSGRLVLRRVLTDGSTAASVTALGDTAVPVPAGVSGRDLVTGGRVGGGAVVAPHATVVVRGR